MMLLKMYIKTEKSVFYVGKIMDKVYVCIKRKDEIEIDNNIEYPINITKNESKIAYTLLRKLMNRVGIIFDIKNVYFSENYKPFYKDDNVFFSYSHSKNYVAVAIASTNIGIDIEEKRDISEIIRVVYLNNKDEPLMNWVKKESYFKLLDSSSIEDFKKIDVDKVKENNYYIDNSSYKCSLFYEGNKKEIEFIRL